MKDLIDIIKKHPTIKQLADQKSIPDRAINIIGKFFGYNHPVARIVKPNCVKNVRCDSWCKVHQEQFSVRHTWCNNTYKPSKGIYYEYIPESCVYNIPAHYSALIFSPVEKDDGSYDYNDCNSCIYLLNISPENFDYFKNSYLCPLCESRLRCKKGRVFGYHCGSYEKVVDKTGKITNHYGSRELIGIHSPQIRAENRPCNRRVNYEDYIGYATWRYKKRNNLFYFHNIHDINTIGFTHNFRSNYSNRPHTPGGMRRYERRVQASLREEEALVVGDYDEEIETLIALYRARCDKYFKKIKKYEKQRPKRMLPNKMFHSKRDLYYICKNLGLITDKVYFQNLTKTELLQRIYPNLNFT